MAQIPGATAPSPSGSDTFSTDGPTSRPQTAGQFPGGPQGAGGAPRLGQNKTMSSMMPPPSPSAAASKPKDGGMPGSATPSPRVGNAIVGSQSQRTGGGPPGQGSSGQQGQNQGIPPSSLGPGPSEPGAPASSAPTMTAPSPSSSSMTVGSTAAQTSSTSLSSTGPGVGLSADSIGNDILTSDFFNEMSTSLSMDGNFDLNFERDFGEWFNPDSISSV